VQLGKSNLNDKPINKVNVYCFFRLSEAHARLMCHGEVTVFDAVSVVYLLETSMDSNGSILSSANPLHSSFPENPTYQYLKDAEMILKGFFELDHI